MFHRVIGHSTKGTEEGFRTRAVHSIIAQARLEPLGAVRRRRLLRPSSEEWFFLQQHYRESSGMGNRSMCCPSCRQLETRSRRGGQDVSAKQKSGKAGGVL